MKLKLYFLIFSVCQFTAKSQNIIGLGSGGKHNSGVFFKVDPKTCESEAIYHFEPAPLSGMINSLQFVNGEIYGASAKGGDKNYGAIFKYSKEDSLFKIIHSFSDSLLYRPVYFTENQGKLYLVSVLQNKVRDKNGEFCPKYDCWKYLFTEFSEVDDTLLVTNQKADFFYRIQWFEKLGDSQLLIQHYHNELLTLNFDDFKIKEVFNLHNNAGLNVHELTLQIGSIRFLIHDSIIHGVFIESVANKTDKNYSYIYNFNTNEFTYTKLNNDEQWENMNSQFRYLNYWDNPPYSTFFYNSGIVQIDNNYRSKGGFHIYNNKLYKIHSLKFNKDNYHPLSVYINEKKLYYFSYTTSNAGKEILALNEYDFEEKKYINLFALEGFSVSPLDIYQYKQIDSLLYFYSYGRLGYINLNSGKHALLLKNKEDNQIYNPELILFPGNNDRVYGIAGNYNGQVIYSFNITKKQISYIKKSYNREVFNLFEIDSCHLLFYKQLPTGFFFLYNFCNNKRIDNFTIDSLPNGVKEMDSIFINWNSRPQYKGSNLNINDGNFEYRISGYGMKDIEKINLKTNKSQTIYYDREKKNSIEHGLLDKRFNKYRVVKGENNSIKGFLYGEFYQFQKDTLIKYDLPKRKRYHSLQTSNPLQIDSMLYSIGENVIKYGNPLIKETSLFKYNFINNKTDTCYLKKYYGRVESILFKD